MALISFDPDTIIDYIPACGGNRDSDDPCVVKLRFVPYSKVQHYSRVLAARTKSVTDPSRVVEITQGVQKKQFCDSMESIHGYYVGEKEVTDPEEFYRTADTELVLEVVRAMESQSKLSESQRKNS